MEKKGFKTSVTKMVTVDKLAKGSVMGKWKIILKYLLNYTYKSDVL